MAKRLEELPLYSNVLEFWSAVSAILKNSQLRRNRKLFEQIDCANDSIDANLKEGIRAAERCVVCELRPHRQGIIGGGGGPHASGSAEGLITDADLARVEALAEPLGKMMGGFIRYLRASGFTDRGRHGVAPSPPKPR